jgi:flagellar biosynthesis/type III secretory pathway chaperone
MISKLLSPWAELSEIMKKQTKHYAKFLDLLNKKEKALIAGDTKKLTKIVKDEENYIHDLELVENKRIKAVKDCLPEHSGQPTLKEVLEAVPADEKEMLEKSAIGLMETLNAVATANHANAELIKEAMNFVNYNVNLLSSDRSLDNLYEGSGKMKGAEPKMRGIINKEA